MSFSVPQGFPGVQGTTYTALPRDIFLGNGEMAGFLPMPITIDGTASANPSNSPYVWHLFAGMPFGMVTSTKKFANSILGLTNGAYTSGGTTLNTDAATATELVRRVGNSGTFNLIGPPSAAGTVASNTVTYSAVNTSTGAITITSPGVNYVTKSIIAPTDGSQTPRTILANPMGENVIDQLKTTRVDILAGKMWAGGGVVNTSYIVNYPADSSLQAWLKTQIRTYIPDAKFSDDFGV